MPKPCEKCGRIIPEASPGGACPHCSPNLESGDDVPEIGSIFSTADDRSDGGLPETIPAFEQRYSSSVFTGVKRATKTHGRAFWAIAGISILLAIYTFFRVLWSQTHPAPAIRFTEDLRIDASSPFSNPRWLAMEPGDQLISVNGDPVETLDDYRRALTEAAGGILRLELTRESEDGATATRQYLFGEVRQFPEIELSDDMQVLSVDGADLEEALGISGAMRIERIGGEQSDSFDPVEYEVSTPGAFRESFNRESGLARWVELKSDQNGATVWVMRIRDWRISWTVYAVGLLFTALGIWVFWLQPLRRSSYGFLFFCVLMGTFWFARSVPFDYRFAFEKHAYSVSQLLLPTASLVFVFTFTALRLLPIGLRYIVLAGLMFAGGLFVTNWMVAPELASEAILALPLFFSWTAVLLSIILVSLFSAGVCRLFGQRLGSQDIQRARVLQLATFAGFFGSTIFTFLRVYNDQWFGITYVAELSVLLFPSMIGYAVVRRNFLQLNDLIRDSMLFGVFATLIVGTIMVLAVFVAPLIQQIFPGTADWFERGITAAILVGGIPIHATVRRRLGERFQRRPLDFEALLESMNELETIGETPETFADRIARDLVKVVQAESIHVLILNPSRTGWRLATSKPETVDTPPFSECGMLIGAIRQLKRPILRDDVVDGVVYGQGREELLEQINRISASVVIPLLNKGVVIGVVSIGETHSHRNLTIAELSLLRRICRHASDTFAELFHRDSSGLAGIAASYPDWPARIGSYDVDGVLGRGGMASVFRGRKDGNTVAIKVASPDVQMDTKLMARFQREADAMSRVQHDSIVAILETGVELGEPFIVLEFAGGGTLADYLMRQGKLNEQEALRIARLIASGLQAAHEKGIAHRDLKPQNILFDIDRNVKVGDFGIARLAGNSTITTTGTLMGTPHYMSPEMLLGHSVGWRADQFALGIMLFEMVTGSRPFTGDSLEAMTYQIVHSKLPSIRSHGVDLSVEFETLVSRMTEKDPKARYPSYEEILRGIDELSEDTVQDS